MWIVFQSADAEPLKKKASDIQKDPIGTSSQTREVIVTGVGKSHLAQAIGRKLVHAGLSVLYRSIFDAVRDFLHDEAFEGHDKIMNRYLKPDLLILDDMQHLANAEAYRRDRRKDQLLQEHDFFVLRFLAEDVGKNLDFVLDAILRTMSHRRREASHL